MKLISLAHLSFCIFLTLSLGGCVKLNVPTTTPESQFYTLESRVTTDRALAIKQATIVVKSIQLPSYLDQSCITMRVNTHRVQFSEFQRWAERLSKGIQQVVIENLSTLQPSVIVTPHSMVVSNIPAYELYIEVHDFIPDYKLGSTILKADYIIAHADGSAILTQGTFNQSFPLNENRKDYEAMVNSLNEALQSLSVAISDTYSIATEVSKITNLKVGSKK